MIAPEVLDAMLAAGCTAEQIVAAVKADAGIEARKREADLERKRVGNAERQQRFRNRRQGRKARGNGSNEDNALRDVTPPNDIYSNPPVSSDDETAQPRKSSDGKPEDVTDPVWRDFRQLRNRQKAPVSETAVAGIRREASKAGWTLNAALAECVARGWRGFKAEWVSTAEQSTGPPRSFLDVVTERNARQDLPA